MIVLTICDRSGEIDFDEMVDGLAKLAPSALITHPKTFYNVIKLDGTDEVRARTKLIVPFHTDHHTHTKTLSWGSQDLKLSHVPEFMFCETHMGAYVITHRC